MSRRRALTPARVLTVQPPAQQWWPGEVLSTSCERPAATEKRHARVDEVPRAAPAAVAVFRSSVTPSARLRAELTKARLRFVNVVDVDLDCLPKRGTVLEYRFAAAEGVVRVAYFTFVPRSASYRVVYVCDGAECDGALADVVVRVHEPLTGDVVVMLEPVVPKLASSSLRRGSLSGVLAVAGGLLFFWFLLRRFRGHGARQKRHVV